MILRKVFFVLFFSAGFIFPVAAELKKGDKIEVLWEGQYYPCTILEAKDEKYLIHYEDYADSYDEWVGTDRIKQNEKTAEIETETKAEKETGTGKKVETKIGTGAKVETKTAIYKTGDKVDVLEGGTWYPSVIKEIKDGKYFIHYVDFNDSYDEWVGTDRIRNKLVLDLKKEMTIRKSGSIWATIDTQGTIRIQGSIAGNFVISGDVEKSGSIVGKIEENGTIRKSGSIVGSIEKNGDYRRGGSVIGSIDKNGTLRNGGSIWGNVSNFSNTDTEMRAVAAVLTFFTGDFGF